MAADISGELKQWHRVSLDFNGPVRGETPETFRDFRLNVTFTHKQTGESFVVPGFFAADGNAAETGASSGNIWRVHFNPPETGTYTYTASFRTGKDIAASADPKAGAVTSFNGDSGSFAVTASDKTGEDFRAKGMLKYVGEHYLQHAGSGDFFIKGGTDSPENFLAYAGFDNTVGKHVYSPHTGDWNTGDPTWQGGKGKGIIGAVNYLAEEGVNSIYFLPMNVGGDGNDVWPWTTSTARTTYDVSKLAQWEILFDHMDRNGIMLHVVTQETENDQLLDGGALGTERAIYYRELIARFGHHNGVVWNLGEENTNTDAQRKAFANYLKDVDPYDHPVVVHTYPGEYDKVYKPLLGHPTFDGPSLQMDSPRGEVLKWLSASEQAGHRWVVTWDEQTPYHTGVMPDGATGAEANHLDIRTKLWGVLTAGGAGAEWYFGYNYPHNDLTLEDFRSRDSVWKWTDAATDFFAALPVTEMRMSDSLTPQTGDYVFAKPGEVYAIYLPKGGTADLNLSGWSGTFDVSWYDPRTGAEHKGSIERVSGGGTVKLGTAPYDGSKDWALLVTFDPLGGGSDGGPGEVLPPVELWLIDSVTDERILKLSSGSLIDPSVLSSGQHNIEAAVDPALGVGSVRFLFGGTTRVENVAPYALFGDQNGDFAGQPVPDGPQTITVEVFSGSNASGKKLADLIQSFEFTADGSPTNTPPVAQDDRANTVQGAAVTIDVLDNDTDSDGDTLAVATVSTPQNGNAKINTNNTVTYTPSPGFIGTDTFIYTVSDGNGGSDTATVTVEVGTAPGGGTVVAAINAGGAAFTAADGTAYKADQFFSGGQTFTSTAAIAGTTDDMLYQSERWGNFSYAFPVADGTYNVTLQFAEIWWDAAGKRVFDVTAEGNKILDDLDIFAAAQGKNKAVDFTVPVAVSDGTLNLQFTTGIDNAKIGAIRVTSSDDGGTASPVELIAISSVPDGTSGKQNWNDHVTISAFDWSGKPAAIVYTADGFGVKGGRFDNQIDHNPKTDKSEQMVLDFEAAVSDVKLRFGRMNPDEVDGGETGKWSAYDAAGRTVDNGILDPDAGDPVAKWVYDIPIDSRAPFYKLVIEATGYDNGSSPSTTESSDFSILALTYTSIDGTFLIA
jgi:hypothetical protein